MATPLGRIFLSLFNASGIRYRIHIRPDEAVKLAGVQPEEITDIVISHSHWDHIGGIDLFPKAVVWIQKEEYRYSSSSQQAFLHLSGI